MNGAVNRVEPAARTDTLYAPQSFAEHARCAISFIDFGAHDATAMRLKAGKQNDTPGGSEAIRRLVEIGFKGKKMTEQEELIQNIRERLGEMPKGALPFDLLAFATTIGQRYSMTEDKILPLIMKEAEALGVNYRIGSSSR